MIIEKVVTRNCHRFAAYNDRRKEMFSESSPREAAQVLYLIPWLLSVNHPKVPGYVAELDQPFKVFGIEGEREIRRREDTFQRLFGVPSGRSLLNEKSRLVIEGLYSIGSVGTLGQTQDSDCDIWICCDRRHIDGMVWEYLHRKINIIKDWLDLNCRMPVYFFLSDVEAVRNGQFGSVDAESSGSAQRNVLKEEFYRTVMVIMGKIPFWWICWSEEGPLSYQESWQRLRRGVHGGGEFLDLGDLEGVSANEFLGAALWQLHKSLTSPLKSAIKMILIKLYLDRPDESLPCHKFRTRVLSREKRFLDPTSFTIELILDSFGRDLPHEEQKLLVHCFYLRCGLTAFAQKRPMRKRLTARFVARSGISRKEQYKLAAFGEWDAAKQVRLGKDMMLRLFRIYGDIVKNGAGVETEMDRRDLTILGRRISAIYQKKDRKVIHLPRPGYRFNLKFLNFVYEEGLWSLYADVRQSPPLLGHADIIQAIAFVVRNGLYDRTRMRMEPNASSVTLQEILNLAEKIRDLFGPSDVVDRDADLFLRAERFTKVLVVISFEKNAYEKDINDLSIVFSNTWGEVYVQRFRSPFALNAFMRRLRQGNPDMEVQYYLQRNASYYEKIIERTKRLTAFSVGGGISR